MAEPFQIVLVLCPAIAQTYNYQYYDPDYDLEEEEWHTRQAKDRTETLSKSERYEWYNYSLGIAWFILVSEN